MSRPSTRSSPSDRVQARPAITDSSVVLPQPLGPTSRVNLSKRESRVSTPRKNLRPDVLGHEIFGDAAASTAALLQIIVIRTQLKFYPRNTIAGSSTNTLRMLIRLASVTISNTAAAVPDGDLPEQMEAAQVDTVPGALRRRRRQCRRCPSSKPITPTSNRLQQNHADDARSWSPPWPSARRTASGSRS